MTNIKMLISVLGLALPLVGAQVEFNMEKPIITKINGFSQSNLIHLNIFLNSSLCENQSVSYTIRLHTFKNKSKCNQKVLRQKTADNRKCNTTEVLDDLFPATKYCVEVFYTVAGNRSKNASLLVTTKKDDKPRKTRVRATNLKPVISWFPRNKWQGLNVSYELETSDNNLGSSKRNWVSRDCKVENATERLQCFPTLPWNFCARFRLRAVVQMPNSPRLLDCNCTTCHCSSYAKPKKFCVAEKSKFSNPDITMSGIQSTSLDVNVRLPKDTAITCEYPDAKYNVFIREMSEWTNPETCKTIPPIVDDGYAKQHGGKAIPTNETHCEGDRAIQSFDFQDLKPATRYCVFGYYTVKDVMADNPQSVIGFKQVTTKRNNVMIIVTAGISFAIVMTAAVLFMAYKLNGFYENFKLFVYGDIPDFIKRMKDEDKTNYESYRSFEDDRKPEVVDKLEITLPVTSAPIEASTTTRISPRPELEELIANPHTRIPPADVSTIFTSSPAQSSSENVLTSEEENVLSNERPNFSNEGKCFPQNSRPSSLVKTPEEPKIPMTVLKHRQESSSSDNQASMSDSTSSLGSNRRSSSGNIAEYSRLTKSDSTENGLVITKRSHSGSTINIRMDSKGMMDSNENFPLLGDTGFPPVKCVSSLNGFISNCESGAYTAK